YTKKVAERVTISTNTFSYPLYSEDEPLGFTYDKKKYTQLVSDSDHMFHFAMLLQNRADDLQSVDNNPSLEIVSQHVKKLSEKACGWSDELDVISKIYH
ncbi:MAG: hypothetical protein Q9181_002778, partial [Wetmoreana brouardii]